MEAHIGVDLTNVTFHEFVQTYRCVVIHFWASRNQVDTLMQNLLATKISSNLQEKVAWGRFDTDPMQHQISNLPFLALYRDGQLMQTVTGMRTPSEITSLLLDMLGDPIKSGF